VITTAPTQPPPPADYYSSLNYPPICPQEAPGGPTCMINMPAPYAPDGSTTYQASARDYVLIRIGDQEPTQADCLKWQNSSTVSITLDGSSVPVHVISCSPYGASWRVDYRYLSPPLTPGTHSATTTVVNSSPMSWSRSISVTP
jgi:hypothetical protein